MLELAAQALHVAFIVFRTLAVLCLSVVTAATREISSRRMLGSRKRSVSDRVAIHIFVSAKAAQLVEIFFRQNLAALNRFLWIRKRIGHPVIHAQIEVGHYKNYGLQLF